MRRRDFLSVLTGMTVPFCAASAVISTGLLEKTKAISITNAYSLWYNRPCVAGMETGFVLGYVTSSGEQCITHVKNDLTIVKTVKLFSFSNASDHGAPSVISLDNGPYAGRILVFFSNHMSELFCVRSDRPNSVVAWGPVRCIDEGAATYSSPGALPDGRIVLVFTLQHRKDPATELYWRSTVYSVTEDGGDNWSEPRTLVDFGPGTFPYSTPISISGAGQCALAYSVYRPVPNLHQGLTLAIGRDAFAAKTEIQILPTEAANVIPYQARWLGERMVQISYTLMSSDERIGISMVATVDVQKRAIISIQEAGLTAIHHYAGGVTFVNGANDVVFSPKEGGLVRCSLANGRTKMLIGDGRYSSPFVFNVHGDNFVAALKAPNIQSTREFHADIFLSQIA